MSQADLFTKISDHYGLSESARRKLADMMQKYRSMDESGKREFLTKIKDKLKEQLNKVEEVELYNGWMNYIGIGSFLTFAIALFLVVFVFVFFGYKLYKSLSERERKREEKKKNKQMKKKK